MQPKERTQELAKALRDAYYQKDPGARAAVELLKLVGEELRDQFVQSAGDDMLRLQGAVRQIERLHRQLTTMPSEIAQPVQEPVNG